MYPRYNWKPTNKSGHGANQPYYSAHQTIGTQDGEHSLISTNSETGVVVYRWRIKLKKIPEDEVFNGHLCIEWYDNENSATLPDGGQDVPHWTMFLHYPVTLTGPVGQGEPGE